MKILELFAGTRSIGNAFERKGHTVYSIEWDKRFERISRYADIEFVTADEIIRDFGRPDVIWASPDCTTYSVAAISHHREYDGGKYTPKTEYAKKCDRVNQHVLELIRQLQPRYFFIENPRGALRKMPWMQWIDRHTVTYCKYGDTRMKPTDIFTNHPNPQFAPPPARTATLATNAHRVAQERGRKDVMEA